MTNFSGLILAPEKVVGYHCCHIETARRILAGHPISPSTNKYDWLGAGIYFWEYAPNRAREWARSRFSSDAAVLMAEIQLGKCLNLMDPAFFEGVVRTYEAVVEHERQAGGKMPINRADKRHYLDRLIMDEHCRQWAYENPPYQTVRGCFPEGKPVYEGSRILRETHVQIAVRDIACVSSLILVE